ncbi:tripartite tricarboxylate transporter TctB family protein [Ancylobacter mangrovi]|uniref:Tripartite tricarboxylate transporter TctB family protein n=1 Tax=Ancylobacter mangrovi TaxID=2972472 RepID=A0A9X2PFY8_9HYPH|nr:tripartite tricarboxylate transporter TctB family protein [Ancylobacter mangrovi]MCS0494792.1 tripartite tricarboxylate transporter TctB family protein [Ancylobacter mangrovi]MCS0502183.1 tripartite tricarboxylate transporter TctB family protein [Ancylobacter mangrovi]
MKFLRTSERSAGEVICALSFLALGAFVVLDGLQYPVMADGIVGPGLMPLVWGASLAAVAVVLVVNALRGASVMDDLPPPVDGENLSIADFAEDDTEAAGKPTTVAGILILMGLSVVLAPAVGLIPMLGVLVFVCVFAFEREGFLTAALMAIGSMAAAWALFVWLFEVPVPVGSVWQAMGF